MKKKPLKNNPADKDIIIELLQEEIKFCHLEISRLETQLRVLKNQVKDTELRDYGYQLGNGNTFKSINRTIQAKLRGITTGQYTSPTVYCSALRRSKDTNR